MSLGKTIFLNGTSSAGKTTLARALQEVLPEPWVHVALDQFRDGLPPQYRGLNAPPDSKGAAGLNVVPDGDVTQIRFGDVGHRVLQGMRRAMVAMVDAGNNIIIDDIILEPAFLRDYVTVFSRRPVYFVGVHCAPAETERRESRRPGRFPGTAAGHRDVCHQHGRYDVEVDTSISSPEACARQIAKFVRIEQPAAFRALAASLGQLSQQQ